jgi:CMP-N-acetylneuraminic acid synthetase
MNSTDCQLSAFIGVRSGSTRAPRKNVRPFDAEGASLLIRKLNQLYLVDEIREIIVSTNCSECMEQAQLLSCRDSRIKIDIRDQSLCLPSTRVEDLARYISSVVSSDNVIWLHVTSPYISSSAIRQGIKTYFNTPGIDSVFSANRIQNFIWDPDAKSVVNNRCLNNKWPNTQDLTTMYEINHGFYIAQRAILETGDRIGQYPAIYECHGPECIDIDWESDFEYAQVVGSAINSKESC